MNDMQSFPFAEVLERNVRQLKCLETAKAGAEQTLAKALEDSKKSAWKRKGARAPGETTSVLQAREALADLEKNYAIIAAFVSDIRRWEQEDNERATWYAGGPKPAFIQAQDAAELRAFAAECVRLPVPFKGSYNPNVSYLQIASESKQEAEAEAEPWVTLSIEDYIRSLETPAAVIAAEAATALKRRQPKWFAQYIADRKGRPRRESTTDSDSVDSVDSDSEDEQPHSILAYYLSE